MFLTTTAAALQRGNGSGARFFFIGVLPALFHKIEKTLSEIPCVLSPPIHIMPESDETEAPYAIESSI